jgi:hypothetical protein
MTVVFPPGYRNVIREAHGDAKIGKRSQQGTEIEPRRHKGTKFHQSVSAERPSQIQRSLD